MGKKIDRLFRSCQTHQVLASLCTMLVVLVAMHALIDGLVEDTVQMVDAYTSPFHAFYISMLFMLAAIAVPATFSARVTLSRVICSLLACACLALFVVQSGTLGLSHDLLGQHIPRITPLSFLVIASAIFALSLSKWTSPHTLCVGALVFSVFLFSVILFLGNLLLPSHPLADRLWYSVPLSNALGFVFLSTALLCSYIEHGREQFYAISAHAPATIAGCILLNLGVLVMMVTHYLAVIQMHTALPWLVLSSSLFLVSVVYLMLRVWQKIVLGNHRLEESITLAQAILEATAEGIVAFSHDGKIHYYNQNFLKMWPDLTGDIPSMLIFELQSAMASVTEDPGAFIAKMSEGLHVNNQSFMDEVRLLNGNCYQFSSRPQRLHNRIIGRVLSFHDISQAKQLECALMHNNTHDELTSLPNRAMLKELLQFAIESTSDRRKVGVVLIDIDRMSMINDLFGQEKGDEVIITVAERLKKAAPQNSSLCRVGADEFILVVNQLRYPKQLKILIDNLMTTLYEVMSIDGMAINLTCSVGASLYPDHGIDVRELLRCADIAMMRAKKQGRNSVSFYSDKLTSFTLEQMQLENDLYKAIETNQLYLHYQPVYNLLTNTVVAVEALVRWKHPQLGEISPDKFIPIAEDIGLIENIGTWVLNRACEQWNEWQRMGMENIRLSVNVAAQQFQDDNIQHTIKKVLKKYNIPSSVLELELTERVLFERNPQLYAAITEMEGFGITLALDDFGTGFSSLNYIKEFPIAKIKIDKSFIIDIDSSPENQKLVKAMTSMARSLNIDILAEGIEKREHLQFLQAQGCEYGQGFYLAYPMDAMDCFHFIRHNHEVRLSS